MESGTWEVGQTDEEAQPLLKGGDEWIRTWISRKGQTSEEIKKPEAQLKWKKTKLP